MNYTVETKCRICRTNTDPIHNFGTIALTSVFPKPTENAVRIPMTVRACPLCGLLQLGENTDPSLLYKDGYGYKSGINESMVRHLKELVDQAALCALPNCNVLDIGSNDGTLLKAWEPYGVNRYGMDPIGSEVDGCTIIRDFFKPHGRKYKVITSIAMFYDLADPVKFAQDIAESLAEGGVWIVEVGYAGAVRDGSWDTICHEHLTYFGVRQLADIAHRAGLNVQHVSFNSANGGSVRFVIGHGPECELPIEPEWDWRTLGEHIKESCRNIRRAVLSHGKVYCLGASTKGNVLLQSASLTHLMIDAAIERNPDKIGRRTPGTNIPIMSEAWANENPPDAFLVLPYHFKDSILQRYQNFRDKGVKFIFPLPELEVL